MLNAIHLYRTARTLHRARIPILPRVFYYLTFLLFNSSLPYTAETGAGTRCAYGGIGVVIHGRARIGRGCTLGQGMTIGGRSRHPEVPVLGDNVYVGAGARILGPIHVGSGSLIAPNAVVLDDVPPRSIVGGIPARILRTDVDIADFV